MKKLFVLIACLFVFVGVASAHEGSIDLTNDKVSCKGISIFQDGFYRVSGRCDGLVYPYETTYNKYVLWGKTSVRGEMVRIAEIDRGYFNGNIASAYDAVYVTAEQNGLARKASTKQIVSGKVSPFEFDKSQVTSVSPVTSSVVGETAVKTASTVSSTAGSVVGKIVTSLFVVILVIVGLAIGASLLFRSRGSVST